MLEFKSSAKPNLLHLLAVFVFFFNLLCQGAAAGPDRRCFYDWRKDETVPGNYVNCKTAAQKKTGATTCCWRGGKIICCTPADVAREALPVWLSIGIISFVLAVIVFVYNWCDVETFPCMEKHITKAEKIKGKLKEECSCCKSKPEDEDDETAEPRDNTAFDTWQGRDDTAVYNSHDVY